MIDIKYKINGQLVNPRDYDGLKISMDWLDRKQEPSINISNFALVGLDGTNIRQRALSGLTGGLGMFQGQPASVVIQDDSNIQEFEGYLDFTDALEFIGECEASVAFNKKQGLDWVNEVADGFSYRYLYDQGIITDADFVEIPYVINYIPDGTQLLILSLSLFTLTRELLDQIRVISESVADLVNASTPVVGVSAVGPVVSVDIGDIIALSLKVLLNVAYGIGIVVALISLFTQLIEQLMPPIRYHKGIPVRLLFQRACDYLGLQFKSNLLDSLDKSSAKWCLLPQKSGSNPNVNGLPQQGTQQDTFAGVVTTYKAVFNADYRIVNGVFEFEKKGSFDNATTYTIPNTFTDQEKLQDVNGFNTNEIKSNYLIAWATDLQDQNTLDNQDGRIFQAQTVPQRVGNQELVNIKGLEAVNIPIALGVRKDGLTAIEQTLKDIVTILDVLTGQLGNPQSLGGRILNRVGSLNLSSNFTNVDKMVVLNGDKLAKDQGSILSAKKLWDNYHSINSFVPINGIHSQYWIYREQPISFCMRDFVYLLNGALIQTETGETAEIEALEWDVNNYKATISYRVNRLYDLNLKLIEL